MRQFAFLEMMKINHPVDRNIGAKNWIAALVVVVGVAAIWIYTNACCSVAVGSPSAGLPGTLMYVRSPGWICASTVQAYGEITKWAVYNDRNEMARAMVMSHSFLLAAGTKVKVLDLGFGRRRVRVMNTIIDSSIPDMGTEGQACWIADEGLVSVTGP